jgi:membrane protein YqaA with SNARE-associated domain
VDTPAQQDNIRDKTVYLFWGNCAGLLRATSTIWIGYTLHERLEIRKFNHCSERVKETAEATMAKREKMMVVVNLEDPL